MCQQIIIAVLTSESTNRTCQTVWFIDSLSLSHMMLCNCKKQQFHHTIKFRLCDMSLAFSPVGSNACHRHIAEVRVHSISAGGKHTFVQSMRWCRQAERATKKDRCFELNSFYSLVLCLNFLHNFQTHYNGSKEKQFILALRAWICHNAKYHFIYLGEDWTNRPFEMTWCKQLVECQVGGKCHVAYLALCMHGQP